MRIIAGPPAQSIAADPCGSNPGLDSVLLRGVALSSMSDHDRESPEKLAQRLTDCETLLAHLERGVRDLDGVVVEQQKRVESLEKKLARLAEAVGALPAHEPQERKPEDEKPPHY